MNKMDIKKAFSKTFETKTKNTFSFSDYTAQNIHLSIRNVTKFLSYIVVLISTLSLGGQAYRYFFNNGEERYLIHLFNLDEETNFPTYFSTYLLSSCSVILFLISRAKKSVADKFTLHWTILSIIFLFMSMDEILMLHEQLSAPIRSGLHTQGFFYYAWLVPAGIVILLCMMFYFKFILDLKKKYQYLFVTSGFIFLLGAYLMEMIGGKFLSFYGQDNFGYAVVTTIEEVSEMSGLVLFIYSLLSYIKTEIPNLSVKLENGN